MGEFGSVGATTTDFKSAVSDFEVDSVDIVHPDNTKEQRVNYPLSDENINYMETVSQIRNSQRALHIYAFGRGYETDTITKVELEHITGMGNDSFDEIIQGLLDMKRGNGDGFLEVVREPKKETGQLINLKPLTPTKMVTIFGPKGVIKHYEYQNGDGFEILQPWQVFHVTNKRVGDNLRGSSDVQAVKWLIDAKEEAMRDERKIRHRELAMGILKIKSNDPVEIARITKQWQLAIENVEALVFGDGLADIQDSKVSPRDRLPYLQYLDSQFYSVFGVPKVIAASEGGTQIDSKVGFLAFEPMYTNEQRLMEQDLWNQLGIKIKFFRPPRLGGTIQEEEAKNTGQVGFQPNDVEASLTTD